MDSSLNKFYCYVCCSLDRKIKLPLKCDNQTVWLRNRHFSILLSAVNKRNVKKPVLIGTINIQQHINCTLEFFFLFFMSKAVSQREDIIYKKNFWNDNGFKIGQIIFRFLPGDVCQQANHTNSRYLPLMPWLVFFPSGLYTNWQLWKWKKSASLCQNMAKIHHVKPELLQTSFFLFTKLKVNYNKNDHIFQKNEKCKFRSNIYI